MIEQQLIEALTKAAVTWCANQRSATAGDDISLIRSPHYLDFDYVSPLALKLSAQTKTDPLATAEDLAKSVTKNLPVGFAEIRVTPPGFINFTLKRQTYANTLTQVLVLAASWSIKPVAIEPNNRSGSGTSRKLISILASAAEPLYDVENKIELPPIIPVGMDLIGEMAKDRSTVKLLFNKPGDGAKDLTTAVKALSAAVYALTRDMNDLADKSYDLQTSVDRMLLSSSIICPTGGITLARLAIYAVVLRILLIARDKVIPGHCPSL